jgi:hypothetical protein
MLKGFRAQSSATYNGAPQGINFTSPLTYSPVDFYWLQFDTSGRYDVNLRRWVPVQGEEDPRLVMCGAQILISGGALPLAPLVNIKMSQIRGGAEVTAYAGQGLPDPAKPGMVVGQATGAFLCEPGDQIGVWIMISPATASAPPFPCQYGLGKLQVDAHWAHTYFWGVNLDPAPLAAAEASIASLTASVDDLQ